MNNTTRDLALDVRYMALSLAARALAIDDPKMLSRLQARLANAHNLIGSSELEQRGTMPPIVAISGSMRYFSDMLEESRELTLRGYCVLMPFVNVSNLGATYDRAGARRRMDALHARKIDLCDFVYVVNSDGYFGEQTGQEIDYAHSIGRPVRFMYELAQLGDEPRQAASADYVETYRRRHGFNPERLSKALPRLDPHQW